MKLSAPKQVTWIVAVVAGVLGFIGTYVAIPVVSGIAFWLIFGAFVLLVLATYLKGLQNFSFEYWELLSKSVPDLSFLSIHSGLYF